MALDLASRKLQHGWIILIGNGERHVALALMRPLFVIVDHELLHEMTEMFLAADDEVIEALDAKGRIRPVKSVLARRDNCPGPNCGRICCRIRAVGIRLPERAVCRIAVNSGGIIREAPMPSAAGIGW